MEIRSIIGNYIKLDGGAMFGNVPRALWEKWIPPDELNRIYLATRALLVRTENHNILFEAGVGMFLEPALLDRFGVIENKHVLVDSLSEAGFSHTDITDIIISHLHFDHAGGLLSSWQEGSNPELLFPNARILVSEMTWDRANSPGLRDRASFMSEINTRLKDSGRLVTITGNDTLEFDKLKVNFIQSDGHTPGMLCSDLNWNGGRLFFVADLIPGRFWIHLPVTMGYDRSPDEIMKEKKELLDSAIKSDAWIFYTHDPEVAVSKVYYDEKKKKYRWRDEQKDLNILL